MIQNGTSLYDVRASLPEAKYQTEKHGMRVFSLPAALVNCSEKSFAQTPTDLRAALSMIRDVSMHGKQKMMTNNLRPVHPGEILREKRAVTPDTALRLARYFGGDAQTWLNPQSTFELKVSREAIGMSCKVSSQW